MPSSPCLCGPPSSSAPRWPLCGPPSCSSRTRRRRAGPSIARSRAKCPRSRRERRVECPITGAEEAACACCFSTTLLHSSPLWPARRPPRCSWQTGRAFSRSSTGHGRFTGSSPIPLSSLRSRLSVLASLTQSPQATMSMGGVCVCSNGSNERPSSSARGSLWEGPFRPGRHRHKSHHPGQRRRCHPRTRMRGRAMWKVQ
mmetsp:Transcript_7656/g.20926  ORF Transcript_7656/g.20926 Transcript_7656/m.20926 type:complete len:200 (-) Transcript_7656:309-908(-)